MVSDLRYVLRKLRNSLGFTLVAVLSLAIGIGANVAMFGVVRTLLLTPMPVEDPDELELVAWTRPGDFSISQTGSSGYTDAESGVSYRSNFSYPIYRSFRSAAPGDVGIFAFAFLRGVSVAMGDQPAFLAGGLLVDDAYFSTLGVPMAVGRPLTAEDDRLDAPLTAVLSFSFWMRAFGGDPGIVGRTVRVNGNAAEVVGVTGRGFKGMSMGGFFPQTDVTIALSSQPLVYPRMSSTESLFTSDRIFWLRVMARVPGPSKEPARQALEAAFRAGPSPVMARDGEIPEVRFFSGSQGAQPVRSETARLLRFLLGVVGVVLLIACVNLATLMLARGASRQRELAVRRALGGGRARIIRLMLLESLTLAALGTAGGLLLAWSTRALMGGLLSGSLGSGAFGAIDMEVVIDPTVVAGSALLGVGATVLFGLLPALRLSGLDPADWLRHRPGAGSASPRLTLGRLLIALQIAVSVPLVVGAGLFLRTVSNLGAVELGFDPTGVVAFHVNPGYTQLPPEEYPALYQELLARVQAIQGVRSATLMEHALMSGISSNGTITVDGERKTLYRNAIGPALVETIGVRLLSGRMPGLQDGPDAPRVGVINEKAVAELFGGGVAIGRMLEVGGGAVQVVGVVNDMPYPNQRDPVPATLYEAALQRAGYGGHHLVLRVDRPIGVLEPTIRAAVADVNRDIPVPEIHTQTGLMAQTSAKERVFTQLLTLFGGFALLLASIGLHGVTSYSVTRRTGEIGVRVALGARPAQIIQLVLRQVVVLTAIGLVVGIPLSTAVGPVVGSLLFGVGPTDPAAIGGAALVMLSVSLIAGLVPALRASGVAPQTALRTE
jgi:predicted permease